MTRIEVLVDGFNVYHSARDVVTAHPGRSAKWLDLRSLVESRVHAYASQPEVVGLRYFSAYATHREPAVVQRHEAYVAALEATGVIVEMGRFKPTSAYCRATCREQYRYYEEKYTDVAIACRLLESFGDDDADMVILVTGDTDLAPAVQTARRMYPGRHIGFLFPFRRKSAELQNMSDRSLKLAAKAYLAHQLPETVETLDGNRIRKPRTW